MRTSRGCFVICLAACPATTGPAITPVSPAEPIAVPLTAATAVTTTVQIGRDELNPPWTLTASDGSGLVLSRVAAKAVVEGPLAFTELHLYFKNDQDRVREGTFQITLPGRAAVSRFAMENAGHWMEAEVVPKLAARRAYEDFLHRRQDPALLEKAAGNQFTARVFPIAPKSEKHLVVSYSQELPGQRYALQLRGLPRTGDIAVELAFTTSDGMRTTQRLAERDWQPDRDFVATNVATAAAVSTTTGIAAQVEIGGAAERDSPKGITLLVDTSASRGLGYAKYIASIRTLVGELASTWGTLPLEIIAFDQDTELVFDGRASELGDAHVRKLLERGAAGASDLGQALAWLGKRKVKSRVVMFGDGVITAGLEGRDLQAAAKRLAAERFDVVLAGGLRDERSANLLVRSLARTGAVLDLEVDRVAVALGESVAVDVRIDVPGASWVFPTRIASARAGTKVMVFAKFPAPPANLVIVAGKTRHTLHPLAGTAPLVERAIAGAEIGELEAKVSSLKGDEAAAIRTMIADKSVRARVLSSETSMLVLESESDYPRYGIDRKALADVLVVGPRGVERLPRGVAAPIPPRIAPANKRREDTVDPRGPTPKPVAQPRTRVVESTNGDRDSDSILDAEDKCPNEPENHNGIDDDDGCPDRGRVITTDTMIIILQPVTFDSERATITQSSYPILDAVAATLLQNPDIAVLEVGGHTDENGNDAYNLQLSDRRARAVVHYLIAKGVDARRLTSRGYGETAPVDPRHTQAAWAKNRRVEFLILKRGDGATMPSPSTQPPPRRTAPVDPPTPPPPPPPVTGELALVQAALAKKDLDGALGKARDFHAREPGNVLALIALGEALEARRAFATAARVYGSIIDLFPGRADMRRFAGERLARLANANDLTIDTFRRAVADRPDHMTGHRLLAYAYVRAGKPADAFAAIVAGLGQTYRGTSYAGGLRVLGEDAGMIGAVYAAAAPARRDDIVRELAKHKLVLATAPSTRFVLYWETDTNDVDLHIEDARGDHAYFEKPALASGGQLYADVTSGYGPECFTIPGTPTGGPYKLSVDYYSQGPMGYGMGMLEIQKFDPRRGFAFEHRPYVIMTAHAKVDLGTYR